MRHLVAEVKLNELATTESYGFVVEVTVASLAAVAAAAKVPYRSVVLFVSVCVIQCQIIFVRSFPSRDKGRGKQSCRRQKDKCCSRG